MRTLRMTRCRPCASAPASREARISIPVPESFDDYDLPLSVNVVRIMYHSRSATGRRRGDFWEWCYFPPRRKHRVAAGL